MRMMHEERKWHYQRMAGKVVSYLEDEFVLAHLGRLLSKHPEEKTTTSWHLCITHYVQEFHEALPHVMLTPCYGVGTMFSSNFWRRKCFSECSCDLPMVTSLVSGGSLFKTWVHQLVHLIPVKERSQNFYPVQWGTVQYNQGWWCISYSLLLPGIFIKITRCFSNCLTSQNFG